jgi:hypothetical protein
MTMLDRPTLDRRTRSCQDAVGENARTRNRWDSRLERCGGRSPPLAEIGVQDEMGVLSIWVKRDQF